MDHPRWGSRSCSDTQMFNFSSQQDIDASVSDLVMCRDRDVFINVVSPTTDLVFPPGLVASNISVTGIKTALNVTLDETNSVGELYMQDFSFGSLFLPSSRLSVREARVLSVNLTSSATYRYYYHGIQVYGNATPQWTQVGGSTKVTLWNITSLTSLTLQGHTVFSSPTLTRVQDLEMDGGGLEAWRLSYIHNNTTMTNFIYPILASDSLAFGGDLTVQHRNNTYDDDPIYDADHNPTNWEWVMESVGGNFAIQDWSNATMNIPSLTTVGKQLSVRDSINSSFVFSGLTSVGSLVMENNGESILPGDFRDLEFADSIELKGKIDNTLIGNIFPSLKLVKQSITIEASNSGFNCSHLAFQQSQGLIGQVNCKAIHDNNSSTDPYSSAKGTGVSRGIWFGVCVNVAIALLSTF
ncbi:hypothetical protein HD806DRAFT_511000 [Xylariaceae sp. AK1471]|nr:hypothetical protein HD806DRAFT_511000 [Xylariaceae sp. AK1471]